MSDIVLISTTDTANGRPEVLARMLASLTRELERLPGSRCILALLLQNCPKERLISLQASLPPFVLACATPGRISLSAARNLLFERIRDEHIEPDTVVGFPDDDCWYPDGALAFIVRQFAEQSPLDLWFCRYAASPSASAGAPLRRASVRDVVRNASSNTMFVRGRVLTRMARRDDSQFDEALGVGTPNLGGEDLDFALRAHAAARLSFFCDRALIGHRDKLQHLRATYYRGSLMVLARYALQNMDAAAEYARKVAIGLYLVLRRELPLRAFISANTLALGELWRAERQHG
ncbi:MAG TPA: hypothetical protein VNR11_05760 [Xanthobacteraceae bacterium]|nr:hypothetical protein [Xanthobacteraceae bacterium]